MDDIDLDSNLDTARDTDLDNELDDLDKLLDDFVFEPNGWDFAVEIGIGMDPEVDRPALDELADAMLVWAKGPELERLTDTAVERIWDDELAGLVRDGIERLGTREDWRAAAAAALVEFDRDPSASEIAREVVRYLAMQCGSADHPWFFCLDCMDCALRAAPAEEHRALAVPAAILGARNANIPDVELRAALASALVEAPARRLGTAARRAAVRARLARLGRLGRGSMPMLAAQLRAIAAEPLPERPEDDDVWQVACTHLLEQKARPQMN
jgi:hypothetical protein